jgi:hypothetical protein
VWYYLESGTDEDKDWINKAVRYLDMRQLLKHHPDNPDLVQILDQ